MKVLLVEPDGHTAELVTMALYAGAGMVSDSVDLGEDALDLARRYDFDAVLVAGDLPDMAGVSALRKMRAAGVKAPVVMLSFDHEIAAKVEALDAGADDYLTRPFHRDELVARLQAVIRRSNGHAVSAITCGPIAVDIASRVVRVAGQPVHLTPREYQMVEVLALRMGSTLTKDALLDGIYGGRDEPELKIIDVFACKIRKKLYAAGDAAGLKGPDRPGRFIETVWGRGYRMSENPEASRAIKPHGQGVKDGVMRSLVLGALAAGPRTYAEVSMAVRPKSEASLRGLLAVMVGEGQLVNIGRPMAALYQLTAAGRQNAPAVAA